MGTIVVLLLLALVLAAAVMLYVAYPYRGEDTPISPRIGEAMRRGVESLPTLDREQQDLAVAMRERAPAEAGSHR